MIDHNHSSRISGKTFPPRTYFAAAAASLATLLVYLPALRNKFVTWDDPVNVYENLHLRSLDRAFFTWAFTDVSISYWQPLVWLSHAFDYAIWGLNPFGHHLTNMLLHAGNTFLVVLLVVRLLQAARDESVSDDSSNGKGWLQHEPSLLLTGGLTGILFGLHPLHVESVAWITERKDLLYSLFFLLSIIAYTGYVAGSQANGPRRDVSTFLLHRRYGASLALFVLSLASKPMAVVLPAVLLLLDWRPFRRFTSGRDSVLLISEKIPFAVCSLAAAGMVFSHKTSESLMTFAEVPLSDRLLEAARASVLYLERTVWPTGLLPYYPDAQDVRLLTFEHGIPLLAVCCITAACFMAMKKRPQYALAWGCYLMTLLPVLGIIKTRALTVADRFTYLPSLGPLVLAAAGAAWTFGQAHTARMRAVLASAAVLIILLLALGTIRQIGYWEDGITLWSYVLDNERVDIAVAHENRGMAFKEQGRIDLALQDFNAAITLDAASALATVGKTWPEEKRRRTSRALEEYNAAVIRDPFDAQAYAGRGMLLGELKLYRHAIADFTTILSLDPENTQALISRGYLFNESGKPEQAMEDLDRAAALDPSNGDARLNRGAVFERKGLLDRAIEDYGVAIELDPSDALAYCNRGIAFAKTGRFDEAVRDLTRSLALQPDRAQAYRSRGDCYRELHQRERAFEDYRTACEHGLPSACDEARAYEQRR